MLTGNVKMIKSGSLPSNPNFKITFTNGNCDKMLPLFEYFVEIIRNAKK